MRDILDITSVFERAKAIKPGKPLLAAANGVLTYGSLIERTERLTGLLRASGVAEGDRAIISSKDEIEAVSAFIGLLRNGITPVIIDPRVPGPEAEALIKASKARCAFIDPELKGRVNEIPIIHELGRAATKAGLLSRLALKKDKSELPAFLQGAQTAELPNEVGQGTDAYMIFTSGTTSRPKCVRISHRALFFHLNTLAKQFGISQDARILNILPLNHADGIVQGPLAAFYSGATVYRPFEFSIQNINNLLDAIYRERITHFVSVPAMLSLIHRLGQGHETALNTGDLKVVISTAAQLERGLWEGFEKRFGIMVTNVYGLSETVAGGLFSGPGESHRIGTVGVPVDCEARVVREDGAFAPDGEAGELIIKGANLMTGYFDDSEATEGAIKDGWLHTGDIAIRESDGFFRIAGRKKNIIISGGLNIQPEEITEALKSHPDVLEAVTFGVEDEIWGEQAVSCVALCSGSGTTGAELISFCRERLAHYKVPQAVHIFAELPKGPSGKVMIPQAKKMALETASAHEPAGQDLRGKVLCAAAAAFKADASELSMYSTPQDLAGWDSLAHLQFIVALEEAFRIRLEPADIVRISSIADAERIVREKLSL